jgi:SAM-dependent methyltransferase
MDEKYWDKVAVDYDGEIFDVLANDRDEIIVSYILKLGSEKKAACDFGCGVGKFLPVLAENFRHVYAIDISGSLLSQAKEACDGFDNISYFKKDISTDKLKHEQVDFALCVNVLIMPDSEIRAGIIKAISEHLRKGGYFLLVVPSLESALYTDFRLLQWNLKEGMDYQESIEELQAGDSTDLALRQDRKSVV